MLKWFCCCCGKETKYRKVEFGVNLGIFGEGIASALLCERCEERVNTEIRKGKPNLTFSYYHMGRTRIDIENITIGEAEHEQTSMFDWISPV